MTNRVVVQFPGLGGYASGILAQLVTDVPRLGTILADIDRVAAAYQVGPVSVPLTDPDGPAIEDLAESPTLLHLASFASAYVLGQALGDKGIDGDVLLGHSTGEITALAAGGALSVPDAARVLCEREVALAEAGVLGGLVAVRAGAVRAERLCGAAGGWSLRVSLSNSPEQTVISGVEQELPRLVAVARAAGVHATRLLVRYPHHNSVLRSAADRVAAATASCSIGDPVARVYSPILGRFVAGADDARRVIDRHLIDPVNYLAAIRTLYDDVGIREFLEAGARSVLTDSAREILPATATLRGAPPNATEARQILDVLTGAATAPVPPRTAAARPIVVPAAEPATTVPAPTAIGHSATVLNSAAAHTLPDDAALVAHLRTVFADTLGYPEDVFTEDAHLEADLGISSVMKTELLVRLLDEYDLPTPPPQLRMRDYATLPKLAGLIRTLAADPGTA